MPEKFNTFISAAISDLYWQSKEWEAPAFVLKALPKNKFDGFSFKRIGEYMADINLGMNTAMQVDPYDESSDCYVQSEDLSADIRALFDFDAMFAVTASGSFDMAYWMDELLLMQTKSTAQFRLCNMQQQKFLLDGVLS
jgi:hypothetical protein